MLTIKNMYIFLCVLILTEFERTLSEETEYRWADGGYNIPIPKDAVLGGTKDNLLTNTVHRLFIGQAEFFNETIPCKIINPNENFLQKLDFGNCWVIQNNLEHKANKFKVLVGPDNFKWIKMTKDCDIPENAIVGGKNKNGDPYYIGRSKHDGRNKEIGQINSSTKVLLTSMNQDMKNWTNYEVLVWGSECSMSEE